MAARSAGLCSGSRYPDRIPYPAGSRCRRRTARGHARAQGAGNAHAARRCPARLPRFLSAGHQFPVFADHHNSALHALLRLAADCRADRHAVHRDMARLAPAGAARHSVAAAGPAPDAGAVPALSPHPGAAVGPASRFPCRPQRAFRQHEPGQSQQPDPVRCRRVSCRVPRSHSRSARAVLARSRAVGLRRQNLDGATFCVQRQ